MKTQAIHSPEALIPYLKPIYQRLYALGLKTGFRISELLSLRVCDVYLPSGKVKHYISVERKNMKGKSRSRTVPLSEASRLFIESFGAPENLSFYQAHLFPFHYTTVNRALETARKEAGIDRRVSSHAMRKTFAKRVFELSKGDLHVCQKALGHTQITSTMQYLEVDQDKLDLVFQQL